MLGRRGPVGVDRLHVRGVGLALPADQEPLGEGPALVDLALRDDRLAEAAGRLRGVRQHHHRDAGQVEAGLLVGDVVGLAHAEHRREHRDAGLHVGADVAGVDRDVVGLGRRQARVVGAVDEQAPDVLERHPADELLDVDAAVAQRRALLVRLGDLGLEGDDALEAVVDLGLLAHVSAVALDPGCAFCTLRSRVDAMRATWPQLRAEYADAGLTRGRPRPRPVHDVRALVRRGAGRRAPRAQRDGARHGLRRRPAVVADGAAQGGLDERGFVFFTNPAPARAPSSPATPAARCCSRGTRSSGRCASTASRRRSRARRSRPTSPRARAVPSSAPGPRTSRVRSPTAPSSRRRTPR